MKKLQTWKPDTCNCKFEEEYDNEDSTVPMTCTKVIEKCQIHLSIADEDLYGVIYANADGENKRKNQMHRILLGYDEIKDLGLEEVKVDENDRESVNFKKGIKYIWSFEGDGKDRVLVVDVKGAVIDAPQKKLIQSLCNKRFGKNKVKVI